MCLFRCFSLTQFCFDEYLSFLLTFVPHYCDFFFVPHSKGDLEFSALTSWYQHWHGKILFFPYKIFFKKMKQLWPYSSCSHLFGASITLVQLFISLWSSFHPSIKIHWLSRKKVWIFWAPIHLESLIQFASRGSYPF